jgi:diphthamide synthase (EF-2-diphthine--ammonia ligase)
MRPRVVVSWSSGKDSAWCLHRLRSEGDADVIGLLTTVTPAFGRVSVHGTRVEVLRAQAEGVGLPLWEVGIPCPCSNEAYETAMGGALEAMLEAWRPTHVAFGDLFLEDIRAYREEHMAAIPLEALFPLWGLDTGDLAREMLDAGVEAVIVSAPEPSPVAPFVGRRWTLELLTSFPDEVDPCGERGEFHTCVVGGPDLDAIGHRVGEVVRREGAVYADVVLASPISASVPDPRES